MVTFVDGQEEKSAYRKFRIRFKNTPDDPLMLKETLRRRLKHQEWAYPDLILMDGGKGQVSAGQEGLREFAKWGEWLKARSRHDRLPGGHLHDMNTRG